MFLLKGKSGNFKMYSENWSLVQPDLKRGCFPVRSSYIMIPQAQMSAGYQRLIVNKDYLSICIVIVDLLRRLVNQSAYPVVVLDIIFGEFDGKSEVNDFNV